MNRGKSPATLVAGVAAVAAVVLAVTGWLLFANGTPAPSPPAPVSHVDTATRACLLTSKESDPGIAGTWAALRRIGGGSSGSDVVVQRYGLPEKADGAAYVNTLVQLRCSTIVTTGDAARSAVASVLAAGQPKGVRFVVVAGRPVAGAVHMSPEAVSARTLTRLVRG
ncbi:hypothetical protein [Streptomyces graminilatus]|uniref:hypothetical protein n=1 Tax=Streptomyces graminilatus TaxID=1464070 RepID=UPI0012FEB17F|nr:hypothetical protein [Streptomyces graminilatus]